MNNADTHQICCRIPAFIWDRVVDHSRENDKTVNRFVIEALATAVGVPRGDLPPQQFSGRRPNKREKAKK